MSKVTFTKHALRGFLREVLSSPSVGWQSTGDLSTSPANVSPVVDPSAAVTNPDNKNFRPRNRMELRAALSSLVDEISDDEASSFYSAMQDTSDEQKEDDMKKETKTEAVIRAKVRQMLSEIGEGPSSVGLGGMIGQKKIKPGFQACEECEGEGDLADGMPCPACNGMGQIPSGKRKNVMMGDVGGDSFKQIAQELGYASESGAKQAADKALLKMRFLMELPPEDLQILTLTAMNDYIELLNKSGELTPADVQLLKDHPNIVSTLEGFREFLEKYIKRAMRQSGQEME